jgi:NADPH-dependent glutamate synthase beta subunit-like oxidoreductase
MMRYGIPKYRLPRDILDAEITRILDMGITLELNATVTNIQAELEADCLVLALGQNADLSVLDGVPGVTFLRRRGRGGA